MKATLTVFLFFLLNLGLGQAKKVEFFGYRLIQYQNPILIGDNIYKPYYKLIGETFSNGRFELDESRASFLIKWANGDDWLAKYSKKTTTKDITQDLELGDVVQVISYSGRWADDNDECELRILQTANNQCVIELRSGKAIDTDKNINDWKKMFRFFVRGCFISEKEERLKKDLEQKEREEGFEKIRIQQRVEDEKSEKEKEDALLNPNSEKIFSLEDLSNQKSLKLTINNKALEILYDFIQNERIFKKATLQRDFSTNNFAENKYKIGINIAFNRNKELLYFPLRLNSNNEFPYFDSIKNMIHLDSSASIKHKGKDYLVNFKTTLFFSFIEKMNDCCLWISKSKTGEINLARNFNPYNGEKEIPDDEIKSLLSKSKEISNLAKGNYILDTKYAAAKLTIQDYLLLDTIPNYSDFKKIYIKNVRKQ